MCFWKEHNVDFSLCFRDEEDGELGSLIDAIMLLCERKIGEEYKSFVLFFSIYKCYWCGEVGAIYIEIWRLRGNVRS